MVCSGWRRGRRTLVRREVKILWQSPDRGDGAPLVEEPSVDSASLYTSEFGGRCRLLSHREAHKSSRQHYKRIGSPTSECRGCELEWNEVARVEVGTWFCIALSCPLSLSAGGWSSEVFFPIVKPRCSMWFFLSARFYCVNFSVFSTSTTLRYYKFKYSFYWVHLLSCWSKTRKKNEGKTP